MDVPADGRAAHGGRLRRGWRCGRVISPRRASRDTHSHTPTLHRQVVATDPAAANPWRIARERKSGETTLWATLSAAAGHLGRVRELVDEAQVAKLPEALESTAGERVFAASALAYARRRLAAEAGKEAFDARVDAVFGRVLPRRASGRD